MSRERRSPRSKGHSRAFASSPPIPTQLSQLPSERLNDRHEASTFDCGNEDLNDWLRLWALNSDAAGHSRTYVWAPDGKVVIAYYAVAPHLVRREDAPRKAGRGSLERIPSFLLARLALSEMLHGRGLGRALLADALSRLLDGIELVGGGLIVVDAIDERAARFYEGAGFVRSPSDRMRLMIKASRVEASR